MTGSAAQPPVPDDTGHPAASEPAQPSSSALRRWAAPVAVSAALVVAGGAYVATRGEDPAAATTPAAQDEDATQQGPAGAMPGGFGTVGTVASVDPAGLVVEGEDGESTTVTVSDDTVLLETVDAVVADLAVGDTVRVQGEAADDGTVTAATVTETGDLDLAGPGGLPGRGGQGLPSAMPTDLPSGIPTDLPSDGAGGGFSGRGPGGGTSGEVSSIGDGTLVVTADDGTTVTVVLTSTTTYSLTQEVALADVAVGETVSVVGATGDDGTVAAAQIQLGDRGFGGFGPGGMPGARTDGDG